MVWLLAQSTGIEWTTATWNPWRGCHPVSAACVNCYADRLILQMGYDPSTVVRASDVLFYEPLSWIEPERIFTCSLSDFFHADADLWRPQAWDIIKRTPDHRYLILTKRPENIAERLPQDWGASYSHVALGVTVENEAAIGRIPLLLQNQASLYFVSCEPLLAELDLSPWLGPNMISWLICGGESIGVVETGDTRLLDDEGRLRCRYSDPEWFDKLRQQCSSANVKFFLKQLGQVDKCQCGGVETCETCYGEGRYLLPSKRDHSRAVLVVSDKEERFIEMPDSVRVPADNTDIFEEAVAMSAQHNLTVNYIDIDRIDIPNTQVRKTVKTASIKELQASIYSYGLIEPIVVASIGTNEGGLQYLLLHGQRRLLAVRNLHKKYRNDERWNTIACVIRTQVPADIHLIAEQFIENFHREDLDVFDRAEAILAYKNLLGTEGTWALVEKNLGISTRRREQIIRVLKLPVEIRAVLSDLGRVNGNWRFTERHARELMRLQHDSQKLRELAIQAVGGQWGLKELRDHVNAACASSPVSSSATPLIRYRDVLTALKAMPSDRADSFIGQLQKDLEEYRNCDHQGA